MVLVRLYYRDGWKARWTTWSDPDRRRLERQQESILYTLHPACALRVPATFATEGFPHFHLIPFNNNNKRVRDTYLYYMLFDDLCFKRFINIFILFLMILFNPDKDYAEINAPKRQFQQQQHEIVVKSAPNKIRRKLLKRNQP